MHRSHIYTLLLVLFSACIGSRDAPAPQNPTLKRIALTYDDAPLGEGPRYSGVERTKAFLQQLEEAGAGPVGIFVTTRGLRDASGRERIAAYAAAGHRIGNHSDQHMWASRTPVADYIADIDLAENKLQGFANRRPWFRFPYLDEGGIGATNRDGTRRVRLRKALADRGLSSGYVTIDTYDWHLDRLWQNAVKDGKSIDMAVLSTLYTDMVLDAARHYDALGQQVLGRRPAQILLLHENDLAASFTLDLVNRLRSEGWTIIDPDDAYADPISEVLPLTQVSHLGRLSALAIDAGLRPRAELAHWSASEPGIEARVAEVDVFTQQ